MSRDAGLERAPASALVPFAVADEASQGRAHSEDSGDPTAPFQLDRHRILHCTAFRRLQYKTQVFVNHEGDHYRTRMTHTLEVVQVARRLATILRVNSELTDAIALAHDLGHPPFGHGGESALDEKMADFGGFEHNAQGLRVVEYLEHPYPEFRGLNLTFETREGVARHQSPYDRPMTGEGRMSQSASLEAQIVDSADEISYHSHDIEDGLGADLINESNLSGVMLWADAIAPVRARHPELSVHSLRRPIIESMQRRMIDDLSASTLRHIQECGVESPNDVRAGPRLVRFSETMAAAMSQLQNFLKEGVYGRSRVVQMDERATRIVGGLFEAYVGRPKLMPRRFWQRVEDQGVHRVVCDYIAGMTDRFCEQQYSGLLNP
jgi:dGTPase